MDVTDWLKVIAGILAFSPCDKCMEEQRAADEIATRRRPQARMT